MRWWPPGEPARTWSPPSCRARARGRRPRPARGIAALQNARRVLTGHASLRSVWFQNSARGARAVVAVAVAVADVTNVQHGFWVVLGTLSVLRTNAASTGATALRALAGTAVGFFIGAGLVILIGSDVTALWVALPIAVLIAAYTPGTFPFAIGQAFFTVTISILYNILVPVGWKVGVIRLEDVAIGAGVSAIVGAFFWPRGASRIVGDDLADAFHRGGLYLVQATAWALGMRPAFPDAGSATTSAGTRLDDAMRAFLAEQGTKKVPKDQVWRLVSGTRRLRLTALSLTASPRPKRHLNRRASSWSKRPCAWPGCATTWLAASPGPRPRWPRSWPAWPPRKSPASTGGTITCCGCESTSFTSRETWRKWTGGHGDVLPDGPNRGGGAGVFPVCR